MEVGEKRDEDGDDDVEITTGRDNGSPKKAERDFQP
jgi:hypothetical protein